MSSIPLWAMFGFLAASLSATQMLIQERFKAAPLAVAFWSKAACAIIMLPFVLMTGLPQKPYYYFLLVAQSLLWVISDVIFYRGINEASAGVIARILPMATIVSFFLWLAIDWQTARLYMAAPLHTAVIVTVLCLLSFFAWNLRHCKVTISALRNIWFVLFASIAGSLSTKYITQQADIAKGVYAYVFAEAIIMLAMWVIYYTLKRPIPKAEMFGSYNVKTGLAIGTVAAFAACSTVYAVYHIDNPAYVTAVRYLDAVLILLFYRATGRPSYGRIAPGLGIVACAAALVALKAHG